MSKVLDVLLTRSPDEIILMDGGMGTTSEDRGINTRNPMWGSFALLTEEGRKINDKIHIPYDAIEQIDKTLFKKKGVFVVTYTQSGKKYNQKLSENTYDNMEAILDHLVAQIS